MEAKVQDKLIQTLSEIPTCVRDFVLSIGVPVNIKGFNHLCTAITLLAKDPALADSITKGLYPAVAEKYDSTPTRVERSIRHAIERSFERVDYDKSYEVFGYTVNPVTCKLTNSEMVILAANRLRSQVLKG